MPLLGHIQGVGGGQRVFLMFERVDFAAEGHRLAFAFGRCRFQRIGLHRQLVQFLGVALGGGVGLPFVFRSYDCRISPEAHLVKHHLRHRLPDFVAFAVVSGDTCAGRLPRVLGHQQFLPHQHALDVFHAVHPAAEADFQIGRHLGFFRCGDGQLAAVVGRRRQNQLLGLDFVPCLIAGQAVSAVNLRAVVVTHPAFGQAVQLPDVVHLGKAQAAFKRRFHNVVAFFHLPFGARVARLVDLHMHVQRLA